MITRQNTSSQGLNAMAATLGQDEGTLQDVVEPYLLKIGFVIRPPRGRPVTPRACEHLGLDPTENTDTADPNITMDFE